ncbi:hypothetical protein [Pedobacter polaris]|uniref:hypothetical protein n=1 Tax=Pedobacter polaris TaxID=2571273 RepID=UPI00145E6F45|nr:hypothetical protein [Pedobacter polaris]
MTPKPVNSKKELEKNQQTDEEKRQAFVDLIAEIIVDISIKEYQEEKSRQDSK